MILSDRLREIGVTAAQMREITPRHAALRDDPLALCVRLFRDRGSVSFEDVNRVFVNCEPPASILATEDGRIRSRFQLSTVGPLFVFSDRREGGAGEVLEPGETAAILYHAARSIHPASEILDLGCGSGVLALLLASRANRVIASDINPRALTLTRINCEVNGIANVELREGSLFDLVADEKFDLIVSQPPFVPRPAGAPVNLFLHGGEHGDELARTLIAQMADHLNPMGKGVVFSDWALRKGEHLAERISCERLHAALFASPLLTVESYCSSYGEELHSHLHQLGIAGVRQCLGVFQHGSGITEYEVLPHQWLQLTSIDPRQFGDPQ